MFEGRYPKQTQALNMNFPLTLRRKDWGTKYASCIIEIHKRKMDMSKVLRPASIDIHGLPNYGLLLQDSCSPKEEQLDLTGIPRQGTIAL